MRANEIDLVEAAKILDLPEEVVCRLVEAGKLAARRADGNLYFVMQDIQYLRRRQAEEARAAEAS